MLMRPKWYRFRLLNAAISRPFLVQIRTEKGVIVSPNICKVIGSDGGYRDHPVGYPLKGIRIGIAERWEFVCDFSSYAGQHLFFYNSYDPSMMLDVPYFCYSHLLAKIAVS